MLDITLLGQFDVKLNGVSITEGTRRSQRVWFLFKYLVGNREKRIPPESFFDILWPEGDCVDPAKALQNLVYRLRMLLNSKGVPHGEDYILFTQGCYSWNPNLPWRIDVQVFEEKAKEALAASNHGQASATDLLAEVMTLYKGDYLPESSYVDWVIPQRNYYKRMYLQCANGLITMLEADKRYGEMLEVYEKAIEIETFDEGLHAGYINTLAAMGRPSQAQMHYEYITSLLYREMGVKPSASLREAYRRIYDYGKDIQLDLDAVQKSFSEEETSEKAYLCDLDVFTAIYRIESRRGMRTGKSMVVALFTLLNPNYSVPEKKVLQKAMDTLERVLIMSLRKGDVIARLNDTQYVALLSFLTLEDGDRVSARLDARFRKMHGSQNLIFRIKMQPLDVAKSLNWGINGEMDIQTI